MRLVVGVILAFGLAFAARAEDAPPTPLLDGHVHVGVANCTSAGCHGDQVTGPGVGPVVGQNEYLKWRSSGDRGAHSRAYQALWNDQAKRIADNLGIGPAYKSPECLTCHADNVPVALRGQRFQIEDAVSCEACHGGAENWLASHRSGPGHAVNIAHGMYPTEDPVARGELCLSCHLGSTAKYQFVTHRIMGAGHPRLKFELDLFTAMQAHHVVDADYRERKAVASGVKVWAIGQALSLRRMLALVGDSKIGFAGAFPELVFFDCHACHQPISDDASHLSWRPNPARGLGPGVPVFNDSNLIMLVAAARVVDPSVALRLESQGEILSRAANTSHVAMLEAASALEQTVDTLTPMLAARNFSEAKTAQSILKIVLSDDYSRRYTNYAAAEQALFAVQRLVADGVDRGTYGDALSRKLKNEIDVAAKAADSPYTYDQEKFRRALGLIAATLGEA